MGLDANDALLGRAIIEQETFTPGQRRPKVERLPVPPRRNASGQARSEPPPHIAEIDDPGDTDCRGWDDDGDPYCGQFPADGDAGHESPPNGAGHAAPQHVNPFAPTETFGAMMARPIPPRQWLLSTILCRKAVTVLAAASGTGKTSLVITWALSLAAGRPLIGLHVHKRCRVLVLSFEDDLDEIRRRFSAACMRYEIHPDDLNEHLFIRSLNGVGITLAKADSSGVMVATDAVSRLEEAISGLSVDVVLLDPWVKISGAPENDNVAVDAVSTILTGIVERQNASGAVAHHVRKGTATPGDMDAARGAGALVAAARVGLTLVPMTPEEAKQFDVSEEDRRQTFRVDDGKASRAKMSATPRWYRLDSVNLGNGDDEYPSGDNVQVVEQWTPPATWDGLDADLLNRVLDDIDAGFGNGERYSPARNAGAARGAWAVVQKHAPDKTDQQCREVIKAWLKSELLTVDDFYSEEQRKTVPGAVVNHAKRPT